MKNAKKEASGKVVTNKSDIKQSVANPSTTGPNKLPEINKAEVSPDKHQSENKPKDIGNQEVKDGEQKKEGGDLAVTNNSPNVILFKRI